MSPKALWLDTFLIHTLPLFFWDFFSWWYQRLLGGFWLCVTARGGADGYLRLDLRSGGWSCFRICQRMEWSLSSHQHPILTRLHELPQNHFDQTPPSWLPSVFTGAVSGSTSNDFNYLQSATGVMNLWSLEQRQMKKKKEGARFYKLFSRTVLVWGLGAWNNCPKRNVTISELEIGDGSAILAQGAFF